MTRSPGALVRSAGASRWRVRWVMFGYMFAFAFVIYLQRTSFSVTAVQMMPELGISQVELGWLFTAYLIVYTVFQLPGGIFGEWLGARKALVITGLVGFAAAMATPLVPLLLTGSAMLLALLVARIALGLAHAPLFAVSTGVFESWFPVGHWGLPNGLQTSGLQFGSAAATPLNAVLMQDYGWKNALLWTSAPALLLVLLWSWYGRNSPAEHPRVSKEELAELQGNAVAHPAAGINRRDLLRVLANKDILLLAISYMIMNYVFYMLATWSFLYLVQERHLSVLESGWLASLPFIAAGVGAGIGGKVTDALAARYGPRIGYRAEPVVTLPLGGLLLFAGVESGNPYLAVGAVVAQRRGDRNNRSRLLGRDHRRGARAHDGRLGRGRHRRQSGRRHRHAFGGSALGPSRLDCGVPDRHGGSRSSAACCGSVSMVAGPCRPAAPKLTREQARPRYAC